MKKDLTKCYECVYLGRRGDEWYCNFGDSDHYDEPVDETDGCFEGEKED